MRRKDFARAWMEKALSFFAVLLVCLFLPARASSGLLEATEIKGEKEIALGLREAVELALQGLDRTGPEMAKWRVREEQGRLWPKVSLQGRYSFERSEIVTQRQDASLLGSGGDIRRYGADVVVRYDLLNFLRSRPRIQEAQAEEQVSAFRFRDETARRIHKTSKAYLTLLSKQETLQSLNVLRSKQLAFQRQQEVKFAEDEIPRIKLIRAKSQLISLDRAILAVRREAASAELNLREITGLGPEHRIALAFDPRHVDLAFIEAQGLSGLLVLAKEGNPRLLRANAAVESARWRMAAKRSLRYPTLDLNTRYGPGHDDISNGSNVQTTDIRYSAFLTLNIPIFDGGVRQSQIAQADLRAASRLREARRAAWEIKALIEDGYWAFVEKEQDQKLLEQQAQLTERELEQAKLRVEGGVDSAREPLAVLSRLVRLKRELARVRSEVLANGIRLALVVGRNPFTLPLSSPAGRLEVMASPNSPSIPLASEVESEGPSSEGQLPSGPIRPVQQEAAIAPSSKAYLAATALPKQTQTAAANTGEESGPRSQAESPEAPPVKLEAEGAQPPVEDGVPTELDGVLVEREDPSALTALTEPTQAAQMLEEIVVIKGQRSTVVSILADGGITQHVGFHLHQPARFVIDLPGIVETALRKPLSVDTPQLKRVRVGRHPGKIRIVFDLAQDGSGSLEVHQTDSGLRVVLGKNL